MQFPLPKRRVSDVENKLRLLYCVQALHQVTDTQLWPFVASLDLMEYMPMQLLLHELLAGGDLIMGAEALSGLISLSQKGQETLRLFAHRIMLSDRELIDAAAPTYRAQLKKRREIKAVYETAREGDYHVLLSLAETELPLLTIRVGTASREYAAQSLRAFEKKASELLAYFYTLASLNQPAKALPDGAAQPIIVTHSPREHSVTATLDANVAAFEITLLFPDQSSAAAFQVALSLPELQKQAMEMLLASLCQEP